MSQQLYSASEAREKLGGMASSSFHRLITGGKIRKITPPGKTHGMYLKEDVDALARELANVGLNPDAVEADSTANGNTPNIVVDWRRRNDLPAILALDMEVYRDEVIGKVDLYHAWWQKNPHITLIAFEESDRGRVLANITLLPLPEELILSILKGERTDKDITADEILSYEDGGEFTLLAENVISRPESHDYIGMIMRKFADFWCEQWPKCKIKRIYAQAASTEGRYLIQKLYFGPLYNVADDAFVLDLQYPNASKFIQRFQQCVKEKEAEEGKTASPADLQRQKWFKE
jgi:hypothetical protein